MYEENFYQIPINENDYLNQQSNDILKSKLDTAKVLFQQKDKASHNLAEKLKNDNNNQDLRQKFFDNINNRNNITRIKMNIEKILRKRGEL